MRRRTHEVVGVCRAHWPTGDRESTQRDCVGDQRPAREGESLPGFAGPHDGNRVVEGRAGARPHFVGSPFQQPGRPRLISAVQELVVPEIPRLGDQAMALQQLRRAHRDQPLVEELLRVQAGPGPRTKADPGVHSGLDEIDERGGGVDLHVDARVLRREIRESRQEPLREVGGDGRHAQGPGAAIGPRLVDRTLEIGERRLDLRPQQRALRRQLNLAPIAAKERHAQILLERLHLHAGGARGDAECVRAAGEALVFGHCDEDPQARERRPPIRRAGCRRRARTAGSPARPGRRLRRRRALLSTMGCAYRHGSMLTDPPLECRSYARNTGRPRVHPPFSGA